MTLGVVVLNWNGAEITPLCLESIYRGSRIPDAVVVVDNASQDGSAELIRQRYPEVELLVNDANLGFSGGCNVGIRHLLERGFDLILLLNNDTEIDRDCIEELLKAAERHPAAAYGAAIYEQANPSVLWYGGGTLNRFTLEARHDTSVGSQVPRPTDFITGCFMLVRADALRRIGLLDTRFFAYYEDLDWCLRGRAAGDHLVYVPGAVLRHDVSHSFRRAGTQSGRGSRFSWARNRPLVMYLSYRNRLLLARKHATGALHRWLLAGRMTVRGIVHAALLFVVGERTRARAVLSGLAAGLFRASSAPEIGRYI